MNSPEHLVPKCRYALPATSYTHSKRETFIALERNHEGLGLLFMLWNGIFLRREEENKPPNP